MTAPQLLLDTAEVVAYWLGNGISPHTIRSWARRGHITRYPGDRYSALEAAEYLEKRPPINARRARRTPTACAS